MAPESELDPDQPWWKKLGLAPGMVGVTPDMVATPPAGLPDNTEDAPEVAPAPIAPVAPAGPPTSPFAKIRESKLDEYTKAIGERPQESHPNWLRKFGALAAAGAGGWTNAAGRTRPIDTQAAVQGILHPGYQGELQEWRNRVAPISAEADLAGQRDQNWWETQNQQAKLADTQSQAKQREADAAYKQHKAELEQNEWKINPKTGLLYSTLTGEVKNPPKDLKAVIQEGVDAGLSPEDAQLRAINPTAFGKPTKEAATFAVNDPEMAAMLGVKPGTQIPSDIFKSALGVYNRPDKNDNMVGLAQKAAAGDAGAARALKLLKPPASSTVVNLPGAALDRLAEQFNATGQLTNIGYGKDGAALKQQIIKRASELPSGATPLADAKQDYAANSAAIKKQEGALAQTNTSEGTALRNLKIALANSDKVDRTGVPLINKGIMAWKTGATSDEDARNFANSVETFANEYASVISLASNGGTSTDSAKAHARAMLSTVDSAPTFRGITAQMVQEMANRKAAFAETLKGLRSRRAGGNTQETAPAAPTPSGIPSNAWVQKNAKTGQLRYSIDGGRTWKTQ